MGIILDDSGEPARSPRLGGAPGGPGGPGPGGTFGFGGGGGLLGGSFNAAGGTDAALLRALIRKRSLGAAGVPSYAATPAPATPVAPTATVGAPAAAASVGGLQPWQGGGGSDGLGGVFGTPKPAPTPPDVPGHGADFGGGALGTISEILKYFLDSGAFGTSPNSGIMAGVRSNALADAEAARQHNALAAQSLGVDSATAASSALQSDLGSQGDVAKALSSASLGELSHQRDFGQQLLLALLGKQGTQNAYNPQQTPWGDIINALVPKLP